MTRIVLLLATGTLAALTVGATAVRAVSRLWLRHWIEHRAGGVDLTTRYLERPIRLVQAAGTAGMLVVFATGAALAVVDGARWWVYGRDLLLASVVLVLLGQILPRAAGRRWAPQLVPLVVPALRLVDLALAPVHATAGLLGRLVRPAARAGDAADVKEGLEELLRDGTLSDMGAAEELAIISGVVQFGDKTVADVMTARTELFMLPADLPWPAMAQQVAQAGYSRIPVYRDSPDTVVGMLHVFDLVQRRGDARPPLRPVTFAQPHQPAKELLFGLLRARRQLAIVHEGATVIGLVTLEDLLEELVGDIRDEHDDSTD